MKTLGNTAIALATFLMSATLPALAAERSPSSGQVASQPAAADLRQIERGLYAQGFDRVSHLRPESGVVSARALDPEGHAVFLGVRPDTGEVYQSTRLD